MSKKGCCGCSDEALRIWRVRYLGLCFLILFSGFQAAQTLVTPIFRSVGTIALTLLYVFFAIGAVFAPIIAAKFGFRVNFIVWGLMYGIWIGTSLSGIDGIFLAMSIVLGFAGGPFWTGQGMYVSAISKNQDVGRYNSAFNLLFFLANPIGNIITGLLYLLSPAAPAAPVAPPMDLSAPSSNSTMPVAAPTVAAVVSEQSRIVLYVLLSICLGGATLFFFVRHVLAGIALCFLYELTSSPYSVPEDARIPDSGPFLKRMRSVWRALISARILAFIPYMLYSGFQLGFNWGVLPTLVELKLVPWLFVCYGLTQCIISPGMGRLYDRFKWRAMIFINLAAAAGAFILVPLFGKSSTTVWPLFIATAYCGIVENQSLTFIQSSLLDHYRDDVAPAVAVFRMLWAIGIAAGFLVQLGLNYVQMSILEACVLAVSATIVVIYELREEKRVARA